MMIILFLYLNHSSEMYMYIYNKYRLKKNVSKYIIFSFYFIFIFLFFYSVTDFFFFFFIHKPASLSLLDYFVYFYSWLFTIFFSFFLSSWTHLSLPIVTFGPGFCQWVLFLVSFIRVFQLNTNALWCGTTSKLAKVLHLFFLFLSFILYLWQFYCQKHISFSLCVSSYQILCG